MQRTAYREMKFRARQCLKGSYGLLAGIQIVTGAGMMTAMSICYMLLAISFVLPMFLGWQLQSGSGMFLLIPGFIALLLAVYAGFILLSGMLGTGVAKIFMELSLAREGRFSDLFFAFRNHGFRFAGLLVILSGGILLCMIPGTILSLVSVSLNLPVSVRLLAAAVRCILAGWWILTYSQAVLFLLEDSDRRTVWCLRASRDMMRGNRLRLLGLWLSFIGWYLLICLSFGIGALWAAPYIGCTTVHFYLSVRMEQWKNPDRQETEERAEVI